MTVRQFLDWINEYGSIRELAELCWLWFGAPSSDLRDAAHRTHRGR